MLYVIFFTNTLFKFLLELLRNFTLTFKLSREYNLQDLRIIRSLTSNVVARRTHELHIYGEFLRNSWVRGS